MKTVMFTLDVDRRLAVKFFLVLNCLMLMSACGGGGGASAAAPAAAVQQTLAAPVISVTAALNGAVLVAMNSTAAGASIYYTSDGSIPSTNSILYTSPFLLSVAQTVNAIATTSTAMTTTSAVASYHFPTTLASGTLLWSDEFSNTTGFNAAPDNTSWRFESMAGGFQRVNNELEVYCGWASQVSPCTNSANAYVGATDGFLHIVAQQPSAAIYTSARITTFGLVSMTYGRIEARIKVPEGQGLWPAFWMLGNNINTAGWPASGEMDLMEHINAPAPDWVAGSLHMTGASGASGLTSHYGASASAFSASDWHSYGMIWSKGLVQYYVDTPTNIYATFQASSLPAGAVWPFDSGQGRFIILNLAIGGNWPGAPDSSTMFPSEMLVDYVRLYAN